MRWLKCSRKFLLNHMTVRAASGCLPCLTTSSLLMVSTHYYLNIKFNHYLDMFWTSSGIIIKPDIINHAVKEFFFFLQDSQTRKSYFRSRHQLHRSKAVQSSSTIPEVSCLFRCLLEWKSIDCRWHGSWEDPPSSCSGTLLPFWLATTHSHTFLHEVRLGWSNSCVAPQCPLTSYTSDSVICI